VSPSTRPSVVIDCDPGHDDALAILLAARHLDVRAITTVHGNAPLSRTHVNARRVLELGGLDGIPVAAGCAEPLTGEPRYAADVHGESGLGGVDLPEPSTDLVDAHAVDVLIDLAQTVPDLHVIAVGPLTNIATALQRDASFASGVSRFTIMGGSLTWGNVTPAAEFNMWFDPEAAAAVCQTAGIEIELAGWHLCRGDAVLGQRDIDHITTIDGPLARFAIDCNRRAREAYREQTGEDGISLPDPVAMALAIDRSIGTKWSRHRVKIETVSELTRGMTVVDRLGVADSESNRAAWGDLVGRPANADVCWTIDAARWKALLYRTLR